MASSPTSTSAPRSRAHIAFDFLFGNSLFLVFGALAALVWANVDYESFQTLTHGTLGADGQRHGFGHAVHFTVNDILMAFFFAIAGKEVWEAMLPGGALSSLRTAGTPLIATAGGMAGPAGLYVLGCYLFDETALLNGWAVPMATDIAFSYLVARLIFGAGHPAIPFLLLLAIADDAAGLIVLAVFYSDFSLQNLVWLFGLVGVAVALALFMHKRLRLHSFWYYLIPGAISWFGFFKGGIHPALGLVPIIPCLPHAKTDLGVFAVEELQRHDTLNEFEHWWKRPVEVFLGLFGLVNAGVPFSAVGAGTWLVMVGLLVGKPLGITLFVKLFGERLLKLSLPRGMGTRDLIAVGMTAGIGFTVALFVATVAFTDPAQLDPVKMGALGSFGAAIVAFIGARALGIRKVESPDAEQGGTSPDAQLHDQEDGAAAAAASGGAAGADASRAPAAGAGDAASG